MHFTMLIVSILVWFTDKNHIRFDSSNCEKSTNYLLNTPNAAFFWLLLNYIVNIVLGGIQKVLHHRS